jgi:hypothetical protein
MLNKGSKGALAVDSDDEPQEMLNICEDDTDTAAAGLIDALEGATSSSDSPTGRGESQASAKLQDVSIAV